MFSEHGNDYDEEVPGGTEFGHDSDYFCGDHGSDEDTREGCSMNKEKGSGMDRVKTIEIMLSAFYVLIAAGLAIIKFIKHIDKLRPA